jgi:hypothetical protein
MKLRRRGVAKINSVRPMVLPRDAGPGFPLLDEERLILETVILRSTDQAHPEDTMAGEPPTEDS